jgi:hypothetical protein
MAGGKEWTTFEVRRLKEMWSTTKKRELKAAFPNRSFNSLACKAHELNLIRPYRVEKRASAYEHVDPKALADLERKRNNIYKMRHRLKKLQEEVNKLAAALLQQGRRRAERANGKPDRRTREHRYAHPPLDQLDDNRL